MKYSALKTEINMASSSYIFPLNMSTISIKDPFWHFTNTNYDIWNNTATV
jgi:hypothetical protein